MKRHRWLLSFCVLALLLSTACLKCPEGTVKCIISIIETKVDPKTGTIEFEKRTYKTCVPPGECPDPPDNFALRESPLRVVGTAGAGLAARFSFLDAHEVLLTATSLVGPVGELRYAAVTATVTREDEFGTVLEETSYSGPLVLRENRGAQWIFTPSDDQRLQDFLGRAAAAFVSARHDERVGLLYRVNLEFSELRPDLANEDFAFDLMVAGMAF